MRQPMKLIALSLAVVAPTAWASGFALQNQNGSGNGNAYAGSAAAAEDAGTIFFNPAGMTLLDEGHNISVGGTYLKRKIEFSDTGTTTLLPPLGTDGGDAGGASVIPAAYWSMSLSPALRLGLGISPTFGNKSEYDATFMGRFSGYYTELKQINVNPSVAYKINDMVSVGFGLNWAKNEIEFRQKTVLGTAQGTVVLKGDDDAWGWNVGAMFQVTPTTRLGVAYRSKIKFDLEGKQTVTIDATGATYAPATYNIRSKLETPDTFSVAVNQALGSQWELLADLTWTGWSSVKKLPLIQASSGVEYNSLSYNFDDTWRIGLGANYKLNDQWKLRVGTAYDKTPIKHDSDRTMTLPDSDRTWLAFGARYSMSKATSLDMSYSHIFFKDTSTARAVTNPATGTTIQTVRGDFDTSADQFSLQLNHRF